MPYGTPGPRLGTNRELPVGNQTVTQLNQIRQHEAHHQRLRDIAEGRIKGQLGNKWHSGPQRSRPVYKHLRQNLKGVQLQAERYDAIERENRLLLSKMSHLMAGGSVLDPTEGTWEFQPGVRLNKHQMPVIDHGISHQPQMPQKGAAREPESLNWGSRRRELERITYENRGIVQRIQGRRSNYPIDDWLKRSHEHDRQLLLLRRPVTSHDLPTPPMPTLRPADSTPRRRRPRSNRASQSAQAPATALLVPVDPGATELNVGLCAGIVKGATLIVSPGAHNEERLVVDDVLLRRSGLLLRLASDSVCNFEHPAGSFVHVYSEADMRFNRARMDLDRSARMLDEEVTARVV